jgi:hypothetical protein
MKNTLMIFGILAVLLLAAGAGLYFFAPHTPRSPANSPSMTPQAQIERITSRLLIKKIEDLKDRAVYLQHREEGRRLLELIGVHKESKEIPDTGSGKVVE